jgi:hypothetical protein
VAMSPLKKVRSTLSATVRQESANRPTSAQIAAAFQKRHARIVANAAPALIKIALIKLIDEVSHSRPRSVDPKQLELFEEFRVSEVISYPIIENGKRVRFERRPLGGLTKDEFSTWIAYRQRRPLAGKADPLDGYLDLQREIAPYFTKADTTVEAAYLRMRAARKHG